MQAQGGLGGARTRAGGFAPLCSPLGARGTGGLLRLATTSLLMRSLEICGCDPSLKLIPPAM